MSAVAGCTASTSEEDDDGADADGDVGSSDDDDDDGIVGPSVVPMLTLWSLSSLAGLSTVSLRFSLSSRMNGASLDDPSEYFIVET